MPNETPKKMPGDWQWPPKKGDFEQEWPPVEYFIEAFGPEYGEEAWYQAQRKPEMTPEEQAAWDNSLARGYEQKYDPKNPRFSSIPPEEREADNQWYTEYVFNRADRIGKQRKEREERRRLLAALERVKKLANEPEEDTAVKK